MNNTSGKNNIKKIILDFIEHNPRRYFKMYPF